mgnify:FL=1
MAFSLPSDLPANWADNVGMIENAAYLNAVGEMNNALKSALTTIVNGAATAAVATAESTSSSSYVDLTTTTDTVTVTIGNSGMAIVLIQAQHANTGGYNLTSFTISGSTTRAADDTTCIQAAGHASGVQVQVGNAYLVTGLTAGSNTFKMKYKVISGTGTFANRRIAVIPLP